MFFSRAEKADLRRRVMAEMVDQAVNVAREDTCFFPWPTTGCKHLTAVHRVLVEVFEDLDQEALKAL
jgi:hypothetical protein